MSAPYITIVVPFDFINDRNYLNPRQNRSYTVIIAQIQQLLAGQYERHQRAGGEVYRETHPHYLEDSEVVFYELTIPNHIEASTFILHSRLVAQRDPSVKIDAYFEFDLKDMKTGLYPNS